VASAHGPPANDQQVVADSPAFLKDPRAVVPGGLLETIRVPLVFTNQEV
jgi:hypothetical protein